MLWLIITFFGSIFAASLVLAEKRRRLLIAWLIVFVVCVGDTLFRFMLVFGLCAHQWATADRVADPDQHVVALPVVVDDRCDGLCADLLMRRGFRAVELQHGRTITRYRLVDSNCIRDRVDTNSCLNISRTTDFLANMRVRYSLSEGTMVHDIVEVGRIDVIYLPDGIQRSVYTYAARLGYFMRVILLEPMTGRHRMICSDFTFSISDLI